MLDSLRKFCRRNLVDNVPDEMDLCLDCAVLSCLEDRFDNCSQRKARAEEIGAGRVEGLVMKESPSSFASDA